MGLRDAIASESGVAGDASGRADGACVDASFRVYDPIRAKL